MLRLELIVVELERFELSSKRGTNELSTCLVSTWFSCRGRQETTNRDLILYDFGTSRGFQCYIPDLTAPPCRLVSEKGQPGDVSFPQLLRK